MRLLTVQSKEVLDIINNKGIYEVDPEKSSYNSKIPKTLKQFADEKLNGKYPIFTLAKEEGKDYFQYNKVKEIPNGTVGYLYTMGAPIFEDDKILLLLEVPDNEYILTAFYQWADMMFWEMEYNQADSSTDPDSYILNNVAKAKDLLYELNPNKVIDTYQGILPCIKKDYILDSIELNNYTCIRVKPYYTKKDGIVQGKFEWR